MTQIEYFTLDELPDRPMFRCDKHRCTMQVTNCASMWRQANERGAPERLDLCRNCPIGAKHAGVEHISLSPLRGMSICARCHTGATRLVRGHLCVSCYNRELEYHKGRNGKGAKPVKHPTLHQLALRVRSEGQVRLFARGHVVDSLELVVAVMRDEGRQTTLSFLSARPQGISGMQGELF